MGRGGRWGSRHPADAERTQDAALALAAARIVRVIQKTFQATRSIPIVASRVTLTMGWTFSFPSSTSTSASGSMRTPPPPPPPGAPLPPAPGARRPRPAPPAPPPPAAGAPVPPGLGRLPAAVAEAVGHRCHGDDFPPLDLHHIPEHGAHAGLPLHLPEALLPPFEHHHPHLPS